MTARSPKAATRLPGRVVASHGRHYAVELETGGRLACVTRGKRGDLACGDRVEVAQTGAGQGVVEQAAPRKTLFYRSDRFRQKLVAANVTQVLIVVAPIPSFSTDLVDRCLAAAEHEGIRPLIVLNKSDLPESAAALRALHLYRELGYAVITIAAKRDVSPLKPHLAKHVSVLVGQSGMGKSTIINRLLPDANARVGEISAALDGGRHTTTHAELYRIDAASDIIDSPGMQEFGLHHLSLPDVADGFVEFRRHHGRCRFNDCRHLGEPGCALVDGVQRGLINGSRFESYRKLAQEIAAKKQDWER